MTSTPPSNTPTPNRPRRRLLWWAPPIVIVAGLGLSIWSWTNSLLEMQSVSEARTVADFVENVGRWASRYGGVHVRTVGTHNAIPGNFLTRTTYSLNADQVAALTAAMAPDPKSLEAYHWKNPALIQREVADVVAESGSKASFRLTAASVLNTGNAPNEFEKRAMGAIREAANADAKSAAAQEYWEVQGRRLYFGRSVVAQKTCLRCHDKAENAPEFLRTNVAFNGGGGFGYVEGKPAGLISVNLPLPEPASMLRHMPLATWTGIALVALGLAWGVSTLVRARDAARRRAEARRVREARRSRRASSSRS
ncbi:DUF3365 domain-containing protein [Roseateles sp.]|uniref:c-type heme family protein n=1 Tax=Roseateles sp. TaxID=1971397 RepID=UPI00394F1AB9